MTMSVLKKQDYKHELISLGHRQFYGIIEEMQFSKKLTAYTVSLSNEVKTPIRF